MKIAKDNGRKTCVAKKWNQNQIKGMIYKSPKPGVLSMDSLHNELKKKDGSVKFLFSIFNTIQVGQEPHKPNKDNYVDDPEKYAKKEKNYNVKMENYNTRKLYSKYVDMIRKEVNNVLINGKKYNDKRFKSNDEIFRSIRNANIDREIKFKTTTLVDIALRKSFKEYREEAICFIECIRKREINDNEKQFISRFLDELRKDFNRLDTSPLFSFLDEKVTESNNGTLIDNIKTVSRITNKILTNPKSFKSNEKIFEGLKNASIDSNINPTELIDNALLEDYKEYKEEARCFIKCIGKKDIAENEKELITQFIEKLRDEYDNNAYSTKCNGTRILNSIECQNTVVQLNNNVVSLPLADNNRLKKNEKDGLNKFLLEYAVLAEDDRMEMLRKLRRLLDLYFAVPDEYDNEASYTLPDEIDTGDFDVWDRHSEGKREDKDFVRVPEELKEANEENKTLEILDSKKLKYDLDNSIRRKNMNGYRFAHKIVGVTPDGVFYDEKNINDMWIHHIENAIERVLRHRVLDNLYKLKVGYLREKIWKDMLNYISIKYIAVGKIVFNFAMDDLGNEDGDCTLGENTSLEGITSFDLEAIKAQETMQRDLAVNVAFAINNFANATVDLDEHNSDLLTVRIKKDNKMKEGEKILEELLKYNGNEEQIRKSILQFFGGYSSWIESDAINKLNDISVCKLIDGIRNAMYSMRNRSFHFKTFDEKKYSEEIQSLIGTIFEEDAKKCVIQEKNKFYSNNLHMFYKVSDLENTLDALYNDVHTRSSQIPSFNSVIVRKNFKAFISTELGIKNNSFESSDDELKWQNALYYVFKEIYYNKFIHDNSIKQAFEEKLNDYGKTIKDDSESRAYDNFKTKIRRLKKYSFAEMCQNIMTEYNLQNNQRRTVSSSRDSLLEKDIYMHYPLLLKKIIAKTFASYIKNSNEYGYLLNPSTHISEIAIEDFLPDWQSEKYKQLISELSKNQELQAWYITGKFLNGRSLNQLIGSIKSYIQYIDDVRKRAKIAKNKINIRFNNENEKKALEVLEVCLKMSGAVSHELTDYFKDEEEYASYLSGYVDYTSYSDHMENHSSALVAFCNEHKCDVYADGKNPIVQKNVIFAKMFGADSVLSKCVAKVTSDNLDTYYEKKENISNYKVKGICSDSDEQRRLIEYQQLANKIELRNLMEYSEIINELLGQLNNWSYLRERDLLYYQLGFHYMCLQNDFKKPESYDCIKRENDTSLKGAILNQITGMYINGIGIYNSKGNIIENSSLGGAGKKIGCFLQYGNELLGDKKGEDLYKAGLEIFEVYKEHANIINVRNDIEHFRFYSSDTISIMGLYSEVFDRFFTYDMKYQKNVMNMFSNILLKHNILPYVKFGTGVKKVGKEDKEAARLIVTMLESERFKYKVDGGIVVNADAKNKAFLNDVFSILSYNDNYIIKTDAKLRTHDVKVDKEKPNKNNNENDNNRNHRKKKNRGEREYKDKESNSFMGGVFDNFDLESAGFKPTNTKKKK